MENRERLSSRIGFILLAAGCAIGLGNVWRFPYIVGQYGGALFVLIYLVFLVILGIPVMTMEFAVGRASQKSVAASFRELEPKGTKWHLYSYFGMAGNYLLMMFYTTIAGWLLAYLFYTVRGDFNGISADAVGAVFDGLTSRAGESVFWMILVCAVGFGICSIGLQKGVERITKLMMSCLFVVLTILVVRAVTLPGAGEGLRFYLMPSLDVFETYGVWNIIYAAMGQAFFTLSLGVGSMSIFGSYIGKDHSLLTESLHVVTVDTMIALMAGLVIFPACFALGVNPGSGPGLIFVTLPNIFNEMPGGYFWGILFFLFMFFAALSTVVAVFENIVSFAVDLTGCHRRRAAVFNFFAIAVLSVPCVLGFSLLSGFEPLGPGTNVLDLEDFLVSNNILPLGSLVFVLFCVTKKGWGWKNFLQEANTGKGRRFPEVIYPYLAFVLPLIMLVVFACGYIEIFTA